MRRAVPLLVDSIHLIALALWLGGLVVVWAALMPAAFHQSGLTLRQAETVAGQTLRGFLPLVELCGITMIGAQFLLRRRYQRRRETLLADAIRQALTFGALLLAEICLRSLLPQMDAARAQVQIVKFTQLHQMYASLATVQAVLLVGIAGLSVWLLSQPVSVTPLVRPAVSEQSDVSKKAVPTKPAK